MPSVKDLSSYHFGQLTVLRRIPATSKGARWLCKCTCGTYIEVASKHLLNGHTKSCKCLQHKTNFKHGYTACSSIPAEYSAWQNMKDRCINIKAKAYKDYGSRGISISPDWVDNFEAFYQSVGPRPTSKHSIDRINNDGNYEPGNVRWATKKEQAVNRRPRNAR